MLVALVAFSLFSAVTVQASRCPWSAVSTMYSREPAPGIAAPSLSHWNAKLVAFAHSPSLHVSLVPTLMPSFGCTVGGLSNVGGVPEPLGIGKPSLVALARSCLTLYAVTVQYRTVPRSFSPIWYLLEPAPVDSFALVDGFSRTHAYSSAAVG